MALTDYISIRGSDGDEPFQGLGSGTITVSGLTVDATPAPATGDATTTADTPTPTTDTPTPLEITVDTSELTEAIKTAFLLNNESILAKAWLKDGASLFEQAWLYQDGDALASIFKKAWLYQDTGDPEVKSILQKALLYTRNQDGKVLLQSALHDMLRDLAFVDATLDFGFLRVLIKGKTIQY